MRLAGDSQTELDRISGNADNHVSIASYLGLPASPVVTGTWQHWSRTLRTTQASGQENAPLYTVPSHSVSGDQRPARVRSLSLQVSR